MKRKLNETASESNPGRRQPQVSCDFCRRKKLKCDRGAPCSSCSVRSLWCGNQTTNATTEPTQNPPNLERQTGSNAFDEPSVLVRLRRLESAIFGDQTPSQSRCSPIETSARIDCRSSNSAAHGSQMPSVVETEQQHLPKPSTKHNREIQIPLYQASIHYKVIGKSSADSFDYSRRVHTPSLVVNLMSREEALLFLYDFVNNPLHHFPIIHEPTVRSTIHKLYDDVATPESPLPHPSHAALVLSLAATCAAFYHDGCNTAHMFQDEDAAVEATSAWLHAALSLLDQSQRTTSHSLEDVQARVIISHVVSSIEGCSIRFMSLHSSCVAIAHSLGLHLIDRPKSNNQFDDKATKEIKRRLWWYIASNDWLLGFSGGPLDGTYSVQPRHMNVRQMRNINDRELETREEDFEHSENVPTDSSFLIQRTRLAEICRIALDSRTPGAPDDDLVDIDSAIYLDGLFETMLRELPPFFQPGGAIPPNAPRCLKMQRDTVVSAIHSRWARLHRGHLLGKYKDPRSQPLRERCLTSARKAVATGTKMIDPSGAPFGSLDFSQTSSHSRRTGVVVGHLFTSCTMLAMVAGTNDGSNDLANISDIKEELRQAYRVLTAVGENSSTAASLVRELTGVLRQYSVQGIADGAQAQKARGENRLPHRACSLPLISGSEPASVPNGIGMGETLMQGTALEQNDLWTDLLGTMTSTEGWDELFTGLDPYCGTA